MAIVRPLGKDGSEKGDSAKKSWNKASAIAGGTLRFGCVAVMSRNVPIKMED